MGKKPWVSRWKSTIDGEWGLLTGMLGAGPMSRPPKNDTQDRGETGPGR